MGQQKSNKLCNNDIVVMDKHQLNKITSVRVRVDHVFNIAEDLDDPQCRTEAWTSFPCQHTREGSPYNSLHHSYLDSIKRVHY